MSGEANKLRLMPVGDGDEIGVAREIRNTYFVVMVWRVLGPRYE